MSEETNYLRIRVEVKDTVDSQKSASEPDLEIDKGGRLKTKLYDKRDAVTFLIVNFHFISNSIQASPVYEVYVIRYSRDWYSDFLDQAQLLTQAVFKQSYVALV